MTALHSANNANVTIGARTDVGCVRPHNEDSMLVASPLLVVADGVGGQEAGEVASSIAVKTMAKAAPAFADAEQLGQAVRAANNAVIKGVDEGIGREGMATTMTAAIIDGSKLVVAQVGDSRAYILRENKLFQITKDHSLMEMLIESGQITEEEAKHHPQRSVITRALGSDPNMMPDIYEISIGSGDRIVICSDGLHGLVVDERMEEILLANIDPQAAADLLVEEAKSEGGYDNITVIVANVGSTTSVVKKTKTRKKRIGIILAIAVCLVIAGIFFGGSLLYAKGCAYLIDEDGYVSLYSGRIDKVAGIELSWFEYKTSVETELLPAMTAEKLEHGIQFDSMDEAESAIENYREQADEKRIEEAQSTSADNDGKTANASKNDGSSNASGNAKK